MIVMELDPRTLPTWAEDSHVNYGLAGGLLGGLRSVDDVDIDLEVLWLLSEAWYHANFGVA